MDAECKHCKALLFRHELAGFCCSHGNYALDFSKYFRAPDGHLLRIFAKTWPYKDSAGKLVHDSHTNAPRLTGFSAHSRRYNNMFCLAVHVVHSSSAQKEFRFGNELAPANIRIHGTMYRKVLSCEEKTPVRYLLIDPEERLEAAGHQSLQVQLVKTLEKAIIPNNEHMQTLQRWAKRNLSAANVSVRLEWHENTKEVAAIVDECHDGAKGPRSVMFALKRSAEPVYLNPLSPLYEPLSYPLWYPYGGRGWSTDVVSESNHKVTQMWWYRQQMLRFKHMHLCGRLLNEWLINMYCRMEDERLSLVRREQHKVATRNALCEVVHNDTASNTCIGKKYFLPSSVPGSPRHLRRLRTDALELARRLGWPTFFITLTCNPRWPEILAALGPGQTAADRPDITVRVFHGRLEKMVAWLKENFAGRKKYFIRVIEYQLRGLPHAHIVLSVEEPPQTAEDIDSLISCELPQSPGPLRDAVLMHMLHNCNRSCHPDDPDQECIKGCPWPFQEDTTFDARGYPHHRRRPCGGSCPNCAAKRAVYGRRNVCCNRLIVEYAPSVLLRWDGHANVRFAGSVNLFEYLYKYLFKGPDKTRYDVTLDATVEDEIAEWQRGRYLCATECAWRICGYNTYERVPHVICLPVHLQGEEWVHFTEGCEEQALSSSFSRLQRYFCRPARPPFSHFKYHEYFEHFMVTPQCPVSLQPHFPNLFPAVGKPKNRLQKMFVTLSEPEAKPIAVEPTLDDGPEGHRCFVYPKLRGDHAICRLEMKYPRQKEVFYLRQILLRYPKHSFADCKRHNGKMHGSHEEALLATGLFSRADEANAVMQELVDLRYTAHQLRFAFLVLLELEAHPITLYQKFEGFLMKDLLHRGLSTEHAQQELKKVLRASWLAQGNSEQTWLFSPDAPELNQVPEQTSTCKTCSTQSLYSRIASDPDQKAATDCILSAVKTGTATMLFVHGPAGSGKSTIATYVTAETEKLKKVVVNLATTGLAALQLPGGATAHSVGKIPLSDEDDITCGLGLNTAQAMHLARASLLQWDEWPSAKRPVWDAFLQLLEDIQTHHANIWCPKVIVCYGDFRQIPPVLKGCDRDAVVRMSVRRSTSWPQFKRFLLRTSHRQKEDPVYAQWIESIGQGLAKPTHSIDGQGGYVPLKFCPVVHTRAESINFCFPHIADPHDCSTKKILATTNQAVDEFNNDILNELVQTHKLQEYRKFSADSLDCDDFGDEIDGHLTTEFLNMQHEYGVPPHELRLVKGALYEIMRNFNPEDRLMNHTPVILREVHSHHVVIETLDKRQFPLPRICFRWALAGGTTTMVRRQYPLRPAYAVTYNGSQGSTLTRCVVDLRKSPFAHGHLYVALGRVHSRHSIRVLTTPERCSSEGHALTKNIVWQELLLDERPAAQADRSRLQKRPAAALTARK